MGQISTLTTCTDPSQSSRHEFSSKISFPIILTLADLGPGLGFLGSNSGSDSVSQSSVTEGLCLQELSAIVENL